MLDMQGGILEMQGSVLRMQGGMLGMQGSDSNCRGIGLSLPGACSRHGGMALEWGPIRIQTRRRP